MSMEKVKEEPAIVDDGAPADGAEAARLLDVRTAKEGEAGAVIDATPDWRDTCAIYLDLMPIDQPKKDSTRATTPRGPKSATEEMRRLQKHALLVFKRTVAKGARARRLTRRRSSDASKLLTKAARFFKICFKERFRNRAWMR
ncbi:hypothetical protein M885DRAFT_563055 [Pelagophyceae sp. CCMP2097]|nr:hypothetical protein M885DRAFT_563055 [Pelagophyceae sp. CCMP2097]